MSQKEAAVSQLDSTKRDLDVELGLELDSCPDDSDDNESPQSWNKSPLHVRKIKRKDGRPVSAEVNYDLTSKKLLIYTFFGDDESSAKTGRRVPESDIYLRRQSTPEVFRGMSGVAGARTTDLSSDPVVRELVEREVVWEKRKSCEGRGGAPEDEAGGAVYPILTWSDLRNRRDVATGERSSSSSTSQRQVSNLRETVRTHLDEIERRGTRTSKQTQNPIQGNQFNEEESPYVKRTGGFQTPLNRGEIGGGSWNACLQTPPRTGSSLPSVVPTNDVQFRSQEDMRRIWPPQIEWRIPDEDRERNSRGSLTHKNIPEIGMKSTEQGKQSSSFSHDANIHRPFWNKNAKFPATIEGVSHSEKLEGSLEGNRGEGSLRQWRDASHVDAKPYIHKGVPLRIDIPQEIPTRQQAKERSQRTEAAVQRTATTYLNFRKPEVIREGLVLQSNFNGTGISRNLNVYSSNRFGEATRTRESVNTETISTDDSGGGGSQYKDPLLVISRKPLEFQKSCQGRYGSLRDADATGSLQRIAISLKDKLDAASRDVGTSGSPTSPKTNEARLETTVESKPQNNEPSKTNEHNISNQVPSFTTVNLSGSKPLSPQNNQNITGFPNTGEDRGHTESTVRGQRLLEDGLESNSSTQLQQLQKDKRFQSESNIQDCPQIDVWKGEFPRDNRPLQDRSCSVPIIIQHRPPPGNFWQHDSFDIHQQPVQDGFPLSSTYQPSEKTLMSKSSMKPTAGDLPTAWNALASTQTIIDSSSSKELKSPDSGRSLVQSAEYIASKNPGKTGIAPKCNLEVGVPAESRGSKQTQDEKTHRNSLPLIFYNSKYKQAEMIDPLAKVFNDGKESDTWMLSSGTGDSQWHSFSGIPKSIETERTNEHVSGECRQDVPLGDSSMTEKKPPKPKLEMPVQSQPEDWQYNTIYEPDTPSPLNEIPPTAKESTQQDDHDDAISVAGGQAENQWSSLPSLLDRSEDHRDPPGTTCQKSISSDKIHSRVWMPTHRRPSLQTSTTGSPAAEENFPETKTTTDKSGSSVWVYLREDATNKCQTGKHKTTYKREIKQIPSIASQMFRNTKRQYETPGQRTQRDSTTQSTKTEIMEDTFNKKTDITSTEPINLTHGANYSDSSFCGLAKTKREREWKSAEVLEQSQDRALNINQRKHSTSGTFEDGELKPGLVHIPIQHEGEVNSARLKETKRVQTEQCASEKIGSILPAVSSHPPEINEISGAGRKHGSAERITSDLPNDWTVQRAIPLRPCTKPTQDPPRSSHLPQIDITTIKARVFRITNDNVTTEFSTASNQLDKSEGLHNKLFTELDLVEEHPLNRDREVLHRCETTEAAQEEVSDQTARRLEDLGMDQTFRDVDYELSKLMKADEPKSNSSTERSVVKPLSSANLSLLDQSRTLEWRNTGLEYAKQWLDSTATSSTSPFDVDNCFNCDENFLNEGMGLSGALPQEESDAERKACSFDAEVFDSILQGLAAGKGQRPYSEGIGTRELHGDCNTCDVVIDNIRPSKARSRDLLTESALGITVTPKRPTQFQVYPKVEKSFVRPLSASLSMKQTQEKEFNDGQRNLPEIPHKQIHESLLKGGESSTRQMALDANAHLKDRSPGSSAMPKGEVEDQKYSVTEHSTSRPRVSSATHLPHWKDDASAAKWIGDHPVEELSGRLTSDEWRKTDIYLAPFAATDKTETRDKNRSKKPRDTDAKNNQQQGKLSSGLVQPDKSLPRRQTSADSGSEPADTKLFHEMTLEWSPVKGNLLTTKAPEQCYVCSRTARLPDIPSLKYYKLSHRCSRSSLQHVDASTAEHSMFLINTRSELSLQELGNLNQLVSGRRGSSLPVRGSSFPVQRNSRRSLSAADPTTVGKKRPISGGLTNVSDPCLSTATIYESASRGPLIRDASGIHHHPLRKDKRDLFARSKVLGESKPTNENRASKSHAESRRIDSTSRFQSSGQTSILGATRQGSMDDTLVRLEQTLQKPSYGDRLVFSPEGRDDTIMTCNVDGTAIQTGENPHDISDSELTENTDVSLEGLLRASEVGHSVLDLYEYCDVEDLFPTMDISTSLFAEFDRGHECNKTAQKHDNFTSGSQQEIKRCGLQGVHQGVGVDEKQESSHYGDRTTGSFTNVVTNKSEISRQSFSLVAARKPGKAYPGTPQRQPDIHPVYGTGFPKETKLELGVPLRYSGTVCDRTTSELRGTESTDDFRAENYVQQDQNKRTLEEIVASFDDLTSPFMKPTEGRKYTEANAEPQSIVFQEQPTVAFPSSSLLPSGRVKYRKISQQISNLIPNYDASTFANNNNHLHSNQDKV